MMANAALAWINYLASAELAANSEVATLPLANIKDLHGATIWRTVAATGIEMTADLGVAQIIQALAIGCATLSAAATWRLRLSSSNAHAGDLYDSGAVPMNRALIANVRGQAVLLLPAPITARYAKINIDDSGRVSDGYLDIGHLWLSDLWQPAHNFSYGAKSILIDGSQTSTSIGGNDYTDIRNKVRGERLTFNFLTDAELYGAVDQIDAVVGTSGNVLAVHDPDSIYLNRRAIIGRIVELEESDLSTVASRSRAFEIRERI